MPVTLVPEQQFFLLFKKVPPGHHSIVRSIVSLGLIFIDKSKLSQGVDLILQWVRMYVAESSMVVIKIKSPYSR